MMLHLLNERDLSSLWCPEPKRRRRLLLAFYWFFFLFDATTFFVVLPNTRWAGPKVDDRPFAFGWYYVFFTFWAGAIQAFYAAVALIDTYKRDHPWWHDHFHAFRDHYFALAFPIGIIVAVVYWGLLFWFEVHKCWDDPIKFYYTFAAHGATTIFIVLENQYVFHRFVYSPSHPAFAMVYAQRPSPRTAGWFGRTWSWQCIPSAVFGGAYGIWTMITRHKNGRFPYTVFDDIPEAVSYTILVLMPFGMGALYYFARWWTYKTWNKTVTEFNKSQDKAEELQVRLE